MLGEKIGQPTTDKFFFLFQQKMPFAWVTLERKIILENVKSHLQKKKKKNYVLLQKQQLDDCPN